MANYPIRSTKMRMPRQGQSERTGRSRVKGQSAVGRGKELAVPNLIDQLTASPSERILERSVVFGLCPSLLMSR